MSIHYQRMRGCERRPMTTEEKQFRDAHARANAADVAGRTELLRLRAEVGAHLDKLEPGEAGVILGVRVRRRMVGAIGWYVTGAQGEGKPNSERQGAVNKIVENVLRLRREAAAEDGD